MEDRKMRALKVFLRVYGVLSLVLFGVLSLGFMLQAPMLAKGGALNWAIWDDVTDHVPLMITVIYFVWSVFLIRAANDPRAYSSFLDFTMWANLAHGLVMIPQAFGSHEYHSKFMTDIPWVLILAGAIALLRPTRSATDIRQEPRTRALSETTSGL
ncbi:MAG: hypothetical protein QOJ17_2659 [Rhodospirillaceae bacterium]|jgi:hypothetical protein|nr:hypothetical protein [Rhodospirillaceae bacterium]